MSLFEEIPEGVPDGAFAMINAFRGDTAQKKVNLSPGIYCDENAKTWVLPSVRKARQLLTADPALNHDISPQAGHPEFVSVARDITFGETSEGRNIISMQTIAGTGANQFAARLLSDTIRPGTVWLSNPSWENHTKIWTHVNSGIKQRYYPYFDDATSTLKTEEMISTLRESASKGDVIVLQACAHNPTGLDPSREDWQRIADTCQEKQLFPIFDSAYQGFATGNIDNDAWAIRHFVARGIEIAVAQSFSKNFGFYGERIGCLHIVTRTAEVATKVQAVLNTISRAQITAAPGFGAKVVATIINTPELREQWEQDLLTMSSRLRAMRQRLHDELVGRQTPGNWSHFLTDIGMFSMTGLSSEKVVRLREEFHIYMLPTGRISFTGLTNGNIEYVAECIHTVVMAS
ncbi:aspartate aminotransferase-like protein [Xylaria arbuscula]|nr:aspartate aminotransferase-like protein [Xylaria arbuscula]